MTAEALLSKLDKVRHVGRGKMQACCPSHNDRRASLSIRELDDGRTLVHCFAGCSVEEVLAAVDLTFDDLFPERPAPIQGLRRERRPFIPADAYDSMMLEVTVVHLIAADMNKARVISDDDFNRLCVAVDRLDGMEAAYGSR